MDGHAYLAATYHTLLGPIRSFVGRLSSSPFYTYVGYGPIDY
jgi:hypothetical protein